MSYESRIAKRRNVEICEDAGMIADSTEVRLALMAKFYSGESTLEEVQAELKRIKRQAAKNGKITRSKAYSNG